MKHVEISEKQIVPLESAAPYLRGLRIMFVNVFAVMHRDNSWTLIDAGLPYTATKIRGWAEKEFPAPPNAIVLTHGHFDHVSAAADLASHWGVPIYAHPLEFPFLTGEKEYPAPDLHAGGGAMTLLSPLYPRGPVNLSDRLQALTLDESGVGALEQLPGWQVLHTPGHTPGHVSFFRPEDKTLIVGDAFCTTKPESFFEAALAQHGELHGPPSYFTSDWNQARRSVQRLAELDPATVAPGHGKTLSGDSVPQALRRLAEDFDAIAIPDSEKRRAA